MRDEEDVVFELVGGDVFSSGVDVIEEDVEIGLFLLCPDVLAVFQHQLYVSY